MGHPSTLLRVSSLVYQISEQVSGFWRKLRVCRCFFFLPHLFIEENHIRKVVTFFLRFREDATIHTNSSFFELLVCSLLPFSKNKSTTGRTPLFVTSFHLTFSQLPWRCHQVRSSPWMGLYWINVAD